MSDAGMNPATPEERFEYLNDFRVWQDRIAPLGDSGVNERYFQETTEISSDDQLRMQFARLHRELLDTETRLGMLATELARRA